MFYAKSRNDNIYCLSDRNAISAQSSKIFCCFECYFFPHKVVIFEAFHKLLCSFYIFLISKSLEKFHNDYVAGDNPVM